MSKISQTVKGHFKEVKTDHTKWVLRNGSIVDLSSDSISDKDLRQLALDNPEHFVLKGKESAKSPASTGK